MEHAYPLLFSILTASIASAQPFEVLDISPVPGDHFIQHYAQYQTPNSGGQSTTEDYSGLVSDSVANVNYVPAVSTPNASSFLVSDVALDDGNGNYTYYHVTADAFEDLGWDLGGNTAPASDPEKWAVFPLGYGTTWTDDHAISFTTSGITTSRSGQVFAQCDANNTTLVMPYGTVTDVKRVYMHDAYTDNVGGFMTIDYDFSYWFYYKAGIHCPVLIVQDLLLTPSIGTPTHTLFSVYVDPGEVGMAEPVAALNSLSLYPQPATDQVNIHMDVLPGGHLTVDVLDLAGQLVRSGTSSAPSDGTHTLEVNGLAGGTYLLRVRCGDVIRSQRLVIR